MPGQWILQTKLSPPSPPSGWLRRPLAPAPVTMLVGGPGYGKTLSLLDLHEAAREAGQATVWYSLEAADADAQTFFHHLAAGVERHIPQFGDALRDVLESDRGDARLRFAGFFEAIAAFNLPALLICLDDAQHLTPEVAGALAFFFDKLPPGLRLAVASRRRWPTPLSRLAATGGVTLLDQSRLRLSPDEAEALARARGLAPPEGWQALVDSLEGWPLGLAWALAHPLPGGPTAAWRAYIEEELYRTLEPETQALLLRLAVLPELTPAALSRVFDREEAASELAALESAHLVQRLAGGAAYRLPTHLREFLLAELESAVPRRDRLDWQARAGRFYREEGRGELAVPLLLAAEAWDEATSAMAPLLPRMRFDGRGGQIQAWLAAIPEAVAAGDPEVAVWRGHLLARAGRSAEAAEAYARARARFEAGGDRTGAFKALVGEINTRLTLQEDEAVERLLASALPPPPVARDEDRADLELILAYEGERRGDMARMRASNEAVLAIAPGDNVEVAASHCIARMNLSTHALYQGELQSARRHLTEAAAIAEAWPFAPYRLSASLLLAHLALLEGDAEAAGALITGLPAMWQGLLDWHDAAIAHTVIGLWRQQRGEWQEAERELFRAVALFEQAGFEEGRLVPIERLMWLAIARKQYARAEALRPPSRDAAESLHHLALAIPQARARHLAGDAAGALMTLEPAIPAFERLGARLHLARARLVEAASRQQLGDGQGARAALEAGLALIARQGYGFLQAQDQRLWAELEPLRAPVGDGRLELRLFGAFEVKRDGVVIDQWPRKKARRFLAALALHPRGLTASELAEILADGEADAANVVRVNAWALRRALEPQLAKGQPSRFVRFEGDRYRLAWERIAPLDLARFDEALAEAERCRDQRPAEAIRHYEAALAQVRGDMLDEPDLAAHFEAEREACRRQAVGALMWLSDHHRRAGAYPPAEAALRRAVALAPCEEAIYLALMRLYRATGDAVRLRAVYWDCRKALKRHLGLAPSPAFEAAYRKLTDG